MGPRPSSGGGRRSLLVGLEPRVCIASYVLVAAYGVWLLLAPFERTPHAELWVAAALSLDNLAAGVALAASGGALLAVAVVALTSCALAAIGFCAGEAVRTHVPGAARVGGVAVFAVAVAQGAGGG